MLEKKYMVVGDFCEYYNDDWQLVTHDIVECSDFKEALQEADRIEKNGWCNEEVVNIRLEERLYAK